jgi:uncharacterized protein YaaN involved in tellurite resistance
MTILNQSVKTDLVATSDLAKDFNVDFKNLPAERKEAITYLKTKLDYADASTIAVYGMDAQKKIANVTDKMLAGVRTADAEEALGSTIGQLTKEMRSVNLDRIGSSSNKGFLTKVFGFFKDKIETYEIDNKTVSENISAIEQNFVNQARVYQQDIDNLGHMYEEAADYYLALEDHIVAALQARQEYMEKELPRIEKEVSESKDILKVNELRDIKMNIEHMDNRIREMLAGRDVVAAQGHTLRMQQQNCKELIAKINDVCTTVIPIWKMQINSGIAAARQKKGIDALNAFADFARREIEAQSEMVKTTSIEVFKASKETVLKNETIELLLADLSEVYQKQREISINSRNLLAQQIANSKKHDEGIRNILLSDSKNRQVYLER